MKRVLLFLPLLLLFLASPAWSAVSLGTCVRAVAGTASPVDITAFTTTAGQNYMVVFIGRDGDLAPSTITSVVWDQGGTNQTMTSVSDNAGTGIVMGAAYTLVNPAIGNLTLRVTYTTGVSCCDVHFCPASGVDTGTPLGTIVETENTGTTTGDSLAFTLNTGGLALAFLLAESPFVSFAQGASQTQQLHTTAGCDVDCQATTTSATVSPMDYTWNSTGRDFWHVVLPINASSDRRAVPPLNLD